MPKSMMFNRTWTTDVITRRPPGAPTVINGLPSLKTRVSESWLVGRFHGPIEFVVPGSGLNRLV